MATTCCSPAAARTLWRAANAPTFWTVPTAATGTTPVTAGAGNDLIYGGTGRDEVHGGDGDDLIDGRDDVAGSGDYEVAYGEAGNDTVWGGDGNDSLSGGEGDDDLSGEGGNDTLAGGNGDDIYRFGRGGGTDSIVESTGTVDGDHLVLDAGITSHQLWFRHVGSSLEVQVVGTSDKLTVTGWYASNANKLDTIETSDGAVLKQSMVDQLVQAMAGFSPPAAGTMTIDDTNYQQVNGAITAAWH